MSVLKTLAAISAIGIWTGAGTLAAQEQAESEVSVEAQIALNVVERRPVDPGTQFPPDVGELYAWTRITRASNTTLHHVWRYEDLEFAVPIEIGGSPWRVWSTKTIPPEWTGEWIFEVRDGDGNVLYTTTFTVGEG